MKDQTLRYDDQVVVVTGAGNGLGKQYALFFASRGAKVVVNDLGGNIKGGADGNNRVANVVVEEIRSHGGTAVPNYDPVQRGANIVQTAIQSFGRVDVLINNAGILRDTTLKNMKEEDWDVIMDVHMLGTLRTVRAAWPYFLRQRYGRIINTSSSSGLFGNFGQSNYAAAKMAILGFSKAIAREGASRNITCNILAPSAGSRLTATVWSPGMMEAMGPERVVPIVGVLAHSSCQENGSIFLAGAGHFSKMRWERSKGLALDEQDYQIGAVLQRHNEICDWKNADHPVESLAMNMGPGSQLPSNTLDAKPLQGKVALVAVAKNASPSTCALGLVHAGATVLFCGPQRMSTTQSISIESLQDPGKIVKEALNKHGRIDILVNELNSPMTDRCLLQNWSEEHWIENFRTQVRSIFTLTKAAWPVFLKQKFGRVVNIISGDGLYGGQGCTPSAAASCGALGFTKTIAREGAKYNIIANAVVLSDDDRTDLISQLLVAALSTEKAPATGQLYESAGGRICNARWQRSGGVDFEYEDGIPSVEEVAKALPQICDFNDGRADNPSTPSEGSGHIHTKGTESAKRISQASSKEKKQGPRL